MSGITGSDPPAVADHAKLVLALVAELVPPSDLRELRAQLPESEDDEHWRQLFELFDAGGWHETGAG